MGKHISFPLNINVPSFSPRLYDTSRQIDDVPAALGFTMSPVISIIPKFYFFWEMPICNRIDAIFLAKEAELGLEIAWL